MLDSQNKRQTSFMLPVLSMNGKTQGQDQGEVLREGKQKDFLDRRQHKRKKGKVAQLGSTRESKADICLESPLRLPRVSH